MDGSLPEAGPGSLGEPEWPTRGPPLPSLPSTPMGERDTERVRGVLVITALQTVSCPEQLSFPQERNTPRGKIAETRVHIESQLAAGPALPPPTSR